MRAAGVAEIEVVVAAAQHRYAIPHYKHTAVVSDAVDGHSIHGAVLNRADVLGPSPAYPCICHVVNDGVLDGEALNSGNGDGDSVVEAPIAEVVEDEIAEEDVGRGVGYLNGISRLACSS